MQMINFTFILSISTGNITHSCGADHTRPKEKASG